MTLFPKDNKYSVRTMLGASYSFYMLLFFVLFAFVALHDLHLIAYQFQHWRAVLLAFLLYLVLFGTSFSLSAIIFSFAGKKASFKKKIYNISLGTLGVLIGLSVMVLLLVSVVHC